VWSGGNRNEPVTLASCHTESIRVADKLQLQTIAFPAISTGIYGYPIGLAAQVAIASTAESLVRTRYILEVKFVLFDGGALQHFSDAARYYSENKSLRLDSYDAS
jgi:O-acetyl-ADP-ribose deacetylase (regulator of RNase III)